MHHNTRRHPHISEPRRRNQVPSPHLRRLRRPELEADGDTHGDDTPSGGAHAAFRHQVEEMDQGAGAAEDGCQGRDADDGEFGSGEGRVGDGLDEERCEGHETQAEPGGRWEGMHRVVLAICGFDC